MSNDNSHNTINAVRAALSTARMHTYEYAAGGDAHAALALYAWNAEVSSALLVPLHICEVVMRNAIASVLEAVYGHQWPWSTTFERSLPNPPNYSPRRDLQTARRSAASAGKVIPELKFVFWQKMLTSSHDTRLWNGHLRRAMPNLEPGRAIAELRRSLYESLEQVRLLRNRIAHHEPIFTRNLLDDYHTMLKLVACRCTPTATWLNVHQRATSIIAKKP